MPDATSPAPRRARLAGDTRQRLLEVATEVFAERGYEGGRVQEIARRAGLTTGAIYSNFAHKSGLLLAVVDLAGKQALRAMPAMDAGDRPADLVRAWAGQLATPTTGRLRLLFVEVLTAARRDAEARAQVVAGLRRSVRDVRRTVERARPEGVSSRVDGDALGHFLLALTVGSYLLESVGVQLPDERSWRELVDEVAEAVGGAGRGAPDPGGADAAGAGRSGT